ncbi:hypothetical protein N657DRAFT_641458 [Parathielavia appendiculata]|uniref:Uncharacterized protein n=1 Tax=Parathielavia appendiculata TaxID=2587402 RepID=A0AAN6Z702_9PEZI|nr:hypothetical protein N657DRAFT_641458 [Parathielavia appendiculata]
MFLSLLALAAYRDTQSMASQLLCHSRPSPRCNGKERSRLGPDVGLALPAVPLAARDGNLGPWTPGQANQTTSQGLRVSDRASPSASAAPRPIKLIEPTSLGPGKSVSLPFRCPGWAQTIVRVSSQHHSHKVSTSLP